MKGEGEKVGSSALFIGRGAELLMVQSELLLWELEVL